jgi:myo-inositol-1(or 4)-monophosphatase
MNLNKLCAEVESISEEVGAYLLQERKEFKQDKVEEKSFNNLVSYVDKTAEKKFIEKLSKLIPEAGFIAEESEDLKPADEWNWIIDPLDGTTNYIFGLPFYCTSVALVKNNELQVGVIYDPTHQELFSAWKDGGAFLNREKIEVSTKENVKQSLIATGIPYDDFGRAQKFLSLLNHLMLESKGIRRIGSAALDLAYVACGRFDSFYEYGLNPWDVAAGALIVKEAGGQVSEFNGRENYIFGQDILASNQFTHQEMLSIIQTYF